MNLKRIIITIAIIVVLVPLAFVIWINKNSIGIEKVETKSEGTEDVFYETSMIYTAKKDDGVYLINRDVNDGVPLFGPAKEIYIEHQDSYARVKCQDDTWAIIDCLSGDVMIRGCSKILELPLVTVVGAAIRDGKVVIFSLSNTEKFNIICEKDGFTDVRKVIMNDYVVVEKNGKYGILYAYNGEIAIPPDYKHIKCFDTHYDDFKSYFLCRKSVISFPKIYLLP